MDIQKSGGVAALDAKAEYIPVESKPQLVDAEQLKVLKDKVYHYFGVNDAIVTGNYNEDQWTAFYESILEPIAVQMSLEFTRKIFTPKEIGHGNRIIFESNRLQYASVRTKTQLIKELMQFGILTINEAREILNLAPIPNGDRRLVSLNYVNADKQDLYQVGKEEE
jgi:phage portal protein BeeE